MDHGQPLEARGQQDAEEDDRQRQRALVRDHRLAPGDGDRAARSHGQRAPHIGLLLHCDRPADDVTALAEGYIWSTAFPDDGGHDQTSPS